MDDAAIKDNFSDLSEFFSVLTKEKSENRKKLENARQRRSETRSSKFIENIKKKAIEVVYGQGYDTAKPVADMSNINASKKKKKK